MKINVISEQHAQLLKEAKIGPFSQKVKNMSKVLKKLRKEKEAEGEVEGEGEGLPHLFKMMGISDTHPVDTLPDVKKGKNESITINLISEKAVREPKKVKGAKEVKDGETVINNRGDVSLTAKGRKTSNSTPSLSPPFEPLAPGEVQQTSSQETQNKVDSEGAEGVGSADDVKPHTHTRVGKGGEVTLQRLHRDVDLPKNSAIARLKKKLLKAKDRKAYKGRATTKAKAAKERATFKRVNSAN
tara:strand:- start:147 stop:875 length:729 start_codon:yes stop_codon:yes gene_type:complete